MDLYFLILVNSFQSSVIISLISENSWFAALYFGGYNMWLATFMSVLGSSFGTILTLAAGFILSQKRNDWFAFKDSIYERFSKYKKYMIYPLIIPFVAFPAVGVFWNAYVLAAGFFGVSFIRGSIFLVISRIIFYSYWLCVNS